MSSVLLDIENMLGISENCTHFHLAVQAAINSALMNLSQLGAVETGSYIRGVDTMWDDLLKGKVDVEAVKTYVYLMTKIVFDPPNNSFVLNSYQHQIDEYAWRIACQVERREFDSG